jgi:hypothetical protein
MTAKTSENLAKVLEGVGLHGMALKARADQYHDFLSDDPLCALTLETELRQARDQAHDPILAKLIEAIRQQHLNGEFDASREESDEWAKSADGIEAFEALLKGGKK